MTAPDTGFINEPCKIPHTHGVDETIPRASPAILAMQPHALLHALHNYTQGRRKMKKGGSALF